MAEQSQSIAKSALSFLSGTMLSRVTGFARDVSMAFFFGTNASIAAFLVALRLSILLRRLFGEGALLNGFVPHFEMYRKESPKMAAQFFRDVFFSLVVLLLILIGSAEFVLWFWAENQIISLMMWMLPGVLFICLFGICSGLLHCEKYFFLTGFAPVAYNMIWICAVWFYRDATPQVAAVGLSCAISLAFFFQWFMTFPKTFAFLRRSLSYKELFCCRIFSLEMRKMFFSLSLGVLGVAAMQINSALDTVFSRFASLEGPAYLNYAIHLQQLPLALFGISAASALLPSLSRIADPIQTRNLLESVLSKTLLFILPCTMAIFALGTASVNLIFGHGHFSSYAVTETTFCLWGYGLGLTPMVVTLLLAPAFYAKKDYWTPTIISLSSIALNVVLNVSFVFLFHFGAASLAFSTSFAALFNAYFLYRKLTMSFSPSFFRTILKIALSAFFSLIITTSISTLFYSPSLSRLFSEQLFRFALPAILFFFLFALLTRKEILSFKSSLCDNILNTGDPR